MSVHRHPGTVKWIGARRHGPPMAEDLSFPGEHLTDRRRSTVRARCTLETESHVWIEEDTIPRGAKTFAEVRRIKEHRKGAPVETGDLREKVGAASAGKPSETALHSCAACSRKPGPASSSDRSVNRSTTERRGPSTKPASRMTPDGQATSPPTAPTEGEALRPSNASSHPGSRATTPGSMNSRCSAPAVLSTARFSR